MKRLIKIGFLLYLGSRFEHYSQKLLLRHGFATVDQYGNLRKTEDFKERANDVADTIVAKITKNTDKTA